jgi:HK97 gp10 family phage protein
VAWSEELAAAIIAGAAQGVTAAARIVAARAKQKAPVRNIFSGAKRSVRIRRISEIEQDRRQRSRLGLAPETATPVDVLSGGSLRSLGSGRFLPRVGVGEYSGPRLRSVTAVNARYRGDGLRRIGAPGRLASPEAEELLTRRGRYEVRSGRANTAGGDVGGTLRDEISPTEAVIEGTKIEARIVSPTPYAKYQEFGTRHNAAHPYLRPALEESRGEIVRLVGQSASAAGRKVPVRGRTKPVRIIIRME